MCRVSEYRLGSGDMCARSAACKDWELEGVFFGLFDTDLAAHGSEHLSQKLSDPTLLEWEVPLAIKHPQDDIPQPRLCAR